jgi:hypothetical protein
MSYFQSRQPGTQLQLKIQRILAVVGILLTANSACSIGRGATPAPGGPSVTITNPQAGQTGTVGEPLLVNSTSVDTDGVQRIELWIDDRLLRVDSNPDLNSPYIVSQSWQSDLPGTHVIVVKAFDTHDAEGASQPITVNLETQTQLTSELAQAGGASPTASTVASTSMSPTPAATPTRTPTSSRPQTSTSTLTPQAPTDTPVVMCTPPPCKADEVYHCPDTCPGGCGTQCATPTPTLEPPDYKPTGIEAHDIFQSVWEQPEVRLYLGYPIQAASDDRRYARQYFDRGYLYWWDKPDERGQIWVIEIPQPTARQGSHWSGPYEDIWDEGDPYSCNAARGNPDGPIRGFGRLWCDHPEIAEGIGAARGSEQGTGNTTNYGVVQLFQGGVMLFSSLDREVWVLFNEGGWKRFSR